MMAPALSIFLLSISLNAAAHAGTELSGPIRDFFANQLDTFARESPDVRASDSECYDVYEHLYDKDTLAISLFIGVCDNRTNLVLDRPIRQALMDHLKKDCGAYPENYRACGFKPAVDDSSTLNKTVLFKSRRKKTVALKIFDSSVSEDYAACIGTLDDQQKIKSAWTSREYLNAMGRDDVVLYIGHSRYGTGPGFCPLPVFSVIGPATFIRRPLLSQMRDVLKNSSSRPTIMGFFSCQSQKFYGRFIHSLSPRSALLVTSEIVTHDQNVSSALGFINSILGMQCLDDLNKSINLNGRISAYHLYGFFHSSPHPEYRRYVPILDVWIAAVFMALLILFASRRFRAAKR